MVTEDYVSFEIAKQMKEKGFDVNCYTHYSSDGQNVYYNYQTPSDGINMPTLQMAMKWLRETYNIILWVEPHEGKYDIHYYQGPYHPKWRGVGYDKWEDACNAGIKFVFDCWHEYKPMEGELYA